MSTLEVSDLTKAYGATKVLEGISFTLRSGGCTALIGPNGAGKSTTIQLSFLVPLFVLLGCAAPLSAEYPRELYDFLVYVNTQPSITDIEAKIVEYEEKYAGRLYEYTEVRLHTLRIFRESIGSRERLDTRNAAAHRNLGTWSLFAPRIAGGGLNKALKSLKRAVALSDNDLDRYFALIWLSQGYMKNGDEKNHVQALGEAGEIFGETVFLGYVRDQNENGKMIGE